MATLIPLEGELTEIPPPKDSAEAISLVGGTKFMCHTAPDGSSWWHSVPLSAKVNERATRFFLSRGKTPNSPTLYGTVLYLSADEARAFGGAHMAPWVEIQGRTYDVREKLKAIGARWDPDRRRWKIHPSRLDEANQIVAKGPGKP